MRTYTLYIEDDRYSVPTLLFTTAVDDDAALRFANDVLAKPHHRSVEVRDDDVVVFRLAAEIA